MKFILSPILAAAACLYAACLAVFANGTVSVPEDMSLIPAGNFAMGRTSGDNDFNAPPSVTIDVSALLMGKEEVSKALWNEVRTWASGNGYTDLRAGGGKALNHPVHTISWFDAVKWCNARSEKEGLTPCYTVDGEVMKTGTAVPLVDWDADGYRLPTEAEWEKAARGGVDGKRFPWGTDTISHNEANFNNYGGESYALGTTGYHPTYGSGSSPYTSPVGSFPSNGYGLHDMAGNVWEWCWDWWGPNYAYGTTDPKGATTGDYRVFRGGSWFDTATSARAANRAVNFPTAIGSSIGFRVARKAVPSAIPPSITTQPASVTINSGETTTLTVAATGTEPLSYQWYQGEYPDISTPMGIDSSSYAVPSLSVTTSFWVRVSNTAGGADSDTATVTVIIPPSISSQPESREIYPGESTTLSVTADGSGPFDYQWYRGSTGDTSSPAGSGASITIGSAGSYWVRVSNAAGSVDSDTAAVSLRERPNPPAITAQPASVEIGEFESVTLFVSAGSTEALSYQWYRGISGDTSTPLGTDDSYTTSTAGDYWVRVSNAAGSVDSDTATVSVRIQITPPYIIANPVAATILTDATATLSVNAGGTGPLSYQWYQGPTGNTSTPAGANSPSFTTPALTATTSYWVRVSNELGSVSSASAKVTVAGSASAVNIPDPALLAALRKALAKPTGDITDLDLLTLTTLRIAGLGIADLTGLEKATNLRILDIRSNNFSDPAALWAVLDKITPMYCLYVDVRRPRENPVGLVTQTLTDTTGNSFYILVDAPNLPSLDLDSLEVDTTDQANLGALQTINESGVDIESEELNLPPYAAAEFTVINPATRSVRLSSVDSSDIDGSIVGRAWSWSGGSAAGFSPTVTLPYGDTTVTLSVTDDDGAVSSTSINVTILRPYTDPVVGNLTAGQREGTRMVDILFDVQAVTPSVATSLRISSDGGATFTVPAKTLTGAIGPGNSTGTRKSITWDAGADWPQQFSETMRFEVSVNDGVGTPADMTLIPAGVFIMGRTSGDADSNAPPVTVDLSAFYMGRYEVTKALWDEVRTWAIDNGYTDLAAGAANGPDHPVRNISWFDMVKWCNARSEKEGLAPCYLIGSTVMKTGITVPTPDWNATGYRLPTEAEWEKAARGGVTGWRFPQGDSISHDIANFKNDGGESYATGTTGHHPAYSTGAEPHTSPVGSFAANRYGLYDMAGNISEWCWDWYGTSTYLNGAVDPRGAATGTSRVIRGGSWNYFANACRAAFRNDGNPMNSGNNYVGFRVARKPLTDVVPPRITGQPISVSTVGPDTATLNVAADGTTPLAYQWYEGDVGNTSTPVGTNSPSFTTPAPSVTTRYWVRVSNAAGSADSVAATVDAMAVIPAGVFTMGSTGEDTDSNAPPVDVSVGAFQIGKFEVSKGLWDEVRTWAIAYGYTDIAEGGGKTPSHPVHSVNWFDILKWCNARSEKESLTPVYTVNRSVMRTGNSLPDVNWSATGYRLPTEAEWEKAARGGVGGKRFPWGTDTITHNEANYFSSTNYTYDVSLTGYYHPNFATDPTPYSSPIGSFAPNGYGLYDMAGNMSEWCWDWYGTSTYADGATDPRGADSGTSRVNRGGSWSSDASRCRAANRYEDPPVGRSYNIGFRVARGPVVGVSSPAILRQPPSIAIINSTATTLSVVAAGVSPISYQWYQGEVGTTTTPVGTNSASFRTPALTQTTSYWVRITNAAGTLDSSAVTVSIAAAPSITAQPESTTIDSGSTATLSVTATGTAPLSYQWYQGDVGTTTTPVGTDSASFTTPELTETTSYWVRVSNPAGNVDSALATVTVSMDVAATELLLIGSGGRVLKFDAENGNYLGDFISGHVPELVYDLRIGPDGDLYVLDFSPKQIHRFDGKTGVHKGLALQFSGNYAEEFVFGPDGNFYLGQNDRIRRYDFESGALLGDLVPPMADRSVPAGMLVDGDNLFVSFLSSPGGGAGVWRFDAATGENGQELVSGLPGNGPRQPFKTSDGRLLVPIWQSNRIERFAAGSLAYEGFWNQIGYAHTLAYSSGGTLLALIDRGAASSVKMLDADTGADLGDFIAQGSGGMGRANSFVRHSLGDETPPADMSLIPAGAFQMGDNLDGSSNAPVVTVNVSAFYMGKYEVTKAEWDEVRTWGASNGYTDLRVGGGKASNHPVHTISWFDMVKWCNARSQKEGLTPVYTVSGAVMKTGTSIPTANWSANGYRLPTEAEWEKAARGGVSGKRFPWGTDTISHSEANYCASGTSYGNLSGNAGFHPTYAVGSAPYSSPVGSFAPNGYGLYDMAGNMWEWCWDWYSASTYVNGASDPKGPASGTSRVLRGGGWSDFAFYCRAAYRYYGFTPTSTGISFGFRVARSSVP